MIRHRFVFSVTVFLLLTSCVLFSEQKMPQVQEVAVSSVILPGTFKSSDVCFRSGNHPTDSNDPLDSIATAKAFHATRFVWCYLWGYNLETNYLNKVKQLGCSFQGSLNSYTWDSPGKWTTTNGRILDLNGVGVTAQWMRSWAKPIFGAWGCVNSAAWRQSVLEAAKSLFALGVDSLQFDDALCNASLVQFGGCFCTNCMTGFRAYLQTNLSSIELLKMGITNIETFDYGAYLRSVNAPVGDGFGKYSDSIKPAFTDFQTKSAINFHAWLRSALPGCAGRPVVVSANNWDGAWTPPYDLFDWGVAELPETSAMPGKIISRLQDAAKRGKKQIFTLVSTNVALTRKVIATTYSYGSPLIVPWDVNVLFANRYFGSVADYGDLYSFVRDKASLLDGYEDAAYVVQGLTDPRYTNRPPVIILDNTNCCAFTRAIPGNAAAPVVVHLVDWSVSPIGFTLKVDKARFSLNPIRSVLFRPGEALLKMRPVDDGTNLTISIPALNPWGILVLNQGLIPPTGFKVFGNPHP